MVRSRHLERHRTDRIGWLRAAVLGANDGIVSTASLLVGVAAAQVAREPLLLTGVAALVAGALSMAAGEFVSVSSQSDTEQAELARERLELAAPGDHERNELAQIYVGRGLDPVLAQEVSRQLMAHDALGAHARDELGITEVAAARPVLAALTSAAAFAGGAALPLAVVALAPLSAIPGVVAGASLVCLAGLGWLAARIGDAPVLRSVLRVVFWGALAMGLTALVGAWFGVAV